MDWFGLVLGWFLSFGLGVILLMDDFLNGLLTRFVLVLILGPRFLFALG